MAWADREWILDGAAVRVSMIGFDARFHERLQRLWMDAQLINEINHDLDRN